MRYVHIVSWRCRRCDAEGPIDEVSLGTGNFSLRMISDVHSKLSPKCEWGPFSPEQPTPHGVIFTTLIDPGHY